MMERRSFLKALAGIIGGVALEEAIPLGRVWSFPSKIVRVSAVSPSMVDLATVYYDKRALEILKENLVFSSYNRSQNVLTP